MFCLAKTFCSPIYSLETKLVSHLQKHPSNVFAVLNLIAGKVPGSNPRKQALHTVHISLHSVKQGTATAAIILPSNHW
jgi:hypothetical protein